MPAPPDGVRHKPTVRIRLATPPPHNSPGPANPASGRATNQARVPVTGRSIRDVDPVTGNRREGSDPSTGQLNGLQRSTSLGRRERIREYGRRIRGIVRTDRQRKEPFIPGGGTAPLGSRTSPQNISKDPLSQHISKGPPPGPTHDRNQKQEAGRPGTPPGHFPGPPPSYRGRSPSPTPDCPPRTPPPPIYQLTPLSPEELRRVENHGSLLHSLANRALAHEARVAEDEWDYTSEGVPGEWPAIDIDKDYIVENSPGSHKLSAAWELFMKDLMVTGPGSCGPWTRTTVRTKADDHQLLLDLAIYPPQSLVVFIELPSEESLKLDPTQRLLSELMHQCLRRFNPTNKHGFDKFLYPEPPTDSGIARAQLRLAFTERPLPRGNHVVKLLAMRTHYYEFTGCAQAAPISYMISKHPGKVAGEITEFVSLAGRNVGRRKAVLIKLGSYDPDKGRHGTPPHSTDPHWHHNTRPASMEEAEDRGRRIIRLTEMSLGLAINGPGTSKEVSDRWPRVDIDGWYAFKHTPGKPKLTKPWMKWVVGRNLGPWTRTTVKTKGDDPRLLLDLAVYPQDSLVVFIKIPSDKILRREQIQLLHSRLMHKALQRFGADYRPKEFIYADPPCDTDIWMAQARLKATYETCQWVAASPNQAGDIVSADPFKVGAINSANPRTGGDPSCQLGQSNISRSSFYELIGSRQSALIGWMIAMFPRDVAGPIDTLASLIAENGGGEAAVVIRLKPRRSD